MEVATFCEDPGSASSCQKRHKTRAIGPPAVDSRGILVGLPVLNAAKRVPVSRSVADQPRTFLDRSSNEAVLAGLASRCGRSPEQWAKS